MNNKINMIILFFTVSLLCLTNLIFGQIEKGKSNGKPLLDNFVNNFNGSVEFYGKVIDQNNLPVPRATIKSHTRFYNPKSKIGDCDYLESITDENGLFVIKDIAIELLTIDEINCNGYQSKTSINDTYTFTQGEPNKYIPDPKKPVVFKIRKMEAKPEYIYNNHFEGVVDDVKETYQCDLILNNFWPKALKDNFRNKISKVDFEIQLQNDDKEEVHVITFKVPGKKNGILEKNERLYTAPADGYKDEMVLKIPYANNDYQTIFYCKGRGGKFYSMIRSEFKFIGKKLKVKFEASTNPNASRNLEEDMDLPAEEWEKMEKKLRSDYGYP